jgi:hypothetical protein
MKGNENRPEMDGRRVSKETLSCSKVEDGRWKKEG